MIVRKVQIDGREIDAVLSYEPMHEAQATEHPIEQGSDPVDHIRVLPVVLELRGVQTATPLDAALSDLTTEALDNRPREAYEFLLSILTDRRLVTVSTELGTFESMALIRLSAPRDGMTGDVLDFAASFRQVRVVSNLTIEAPTAITMKPKKIGKPPTTPTKAATVDKSLAAEAADSGTGTKILDAVGLEWLHN